MTLTRRVGLQGSQTGLNQAELRRGPGPRRYATLPRSGRLRPRSAKAVARQPARDDCVAIVKERDEVCVCCALRPVDHVHELKRRTQGGDPTNPEHCVGVCWICHRWIEDNDEEAHRLGLRRWSHEDPSIYGGQTRPNTVHWDPETRSAPGRYERPGAPDQPGHRGGTDRI